MITTLLLLLFIYVALFYIEVMDERYDWFGDNEALYTFVKVVRILSLPAMLLLIILHFLLKFW